MNTLENDESRAMERGVVSRCGKAAVLLLSHSESNLAPLQTLLSREPEGYSTRLLRNSEEVYDSGTAVAAGRLVLCEPGFDVRLLEAAAWTIDVTEAFAPVYVLRCSDDAARPLTGCPGFLRVCGVVNYTKGWSDAWKRLSGLWAAWRSPFLSSRIEDVSVSDVLQMVGVGGWTCAVRIDGAAGRHALEERREATRGCLYFSKGVPEYAWSSGHAGSEAVKELLAVRHGALHVFRRAWAPPLCNLKATVEELLLAHAVEQDESTAGVETDAGVGVRIGSVREEMISGRRNDLSPDEEELSCGMSRAEHGNGDNSPDAAVRPLDQWWRAESRTIGSAFRTCTGKPFPLRWMSHRELMRLITDRERRRFISLVGERTFLERVIEHCAGDADRSMFDTAAVPVLRVGRFDSVCLYVVGLLGESEVPVLPEYSPCIAYAPSEEVAAKIRRMRYARTVLFIPAANAPADGPAIESDNTQVWLRCAWDLDEEPDGIVAVLERAVAFFGGQTRRTTL